MRFRVASGIVTVRPSSSGASTIWQPSRELSKLEKNSESRFGLLFLQLQQNESLRGKSSQQKPNPTYLLLFQWARATHQKNLLAHRHGKSSKPRLLRKHLERVAYEKANKPSKSILLLCAVDITVSPTWNNHFSFIQSKGTLRAFPVAWKLSPLRKTYVSAIVCFSLL